MPAVRRKGGLLPDFLAGLQEGIVHVSMPGFLSQVLR